MKENKLGLLVILLAISAILLYAQESDPLVGQWEHVSGDWIWYFGNSGINFSSNGTVIGEEGSGIWTVFGGERLRIDYDGGNTENFTFSVRNNILTIIDSDGDLGRWRRIN